MASVSSLYQEARPLEMSQAGSMRRRVVQMTAAWLFLGALVGIGTGATSGGSLAAIVSSVLAGMILFPPVGLLLGLIGGRPKETLLGAAAGAIVGALLGAVAGPIEITTHALLVGALGGATLRPYLMLAKWLYSALHAAAGYTLRMAGRLDSQ